MELIHNPLEISRSKKAVDTSITLYFIPNWYIWKLQAYLIECIISSGTDCKYIYLSTTTYTAYEVWGGLQFSKINSDILNPVNLLFSCMAEEDTEICFLEEAGKPRVHNQDSGRGQYWQTPIKKGVQWSSLWSRNQVQTVPRTAAKSQSHGLNQWATLPPACLEGE